MAIAVFVFALASQAAAPALPEGPPPGLVGAPLETRAFSGSLARIVRSRGAGPAWIGYAVPSLRPRHMCCYDCVHEARSRPHGCCRLEGRRGAISHEPPTTEPAPTLRLEASPGASPFALILLRVEGGRVGRLAVYSADCNLDAGGLRVVWLSGVPPAESLSVLESLITPPTLEEALAAVAAHAGSAADRVLERQVAPGQAREAREHAAFWLGEARGRRGFEVLRSVMQGEADHKLREHVVFALSVSDVPEAVDVLIDTARRDRDPDVRGQALFWLAQKAGQKAAAAITRAIEDDPDTEVKRKAVFALSELEGGVPLLIEVARTNRNPAVREQAFFWLGQSEDARALDFLAEVLRRP
jgi:hypothetical protein